VAYSSGEKTVHTPPGLRKSAIPLATEIPAPVSAAADRACLNFATASSRWVSFLPGVIVFIAKIDRPSITSPAFLLLLFTIRAQGDTLHNLPVIVLLAVDVDGRILLGVDLHQQNIEFFSSV
jgi:hypothetical protein